MFFDKLFGRKGKVDEPAVAASHTPVIDNDHGWVEIKGGRVVVHDPFDGGKFATVVAAGGVRVWINGEPLTDVTVVSASDEIRWELDPQQFFTLNIDDEQMTVTMVLIADPDRLPDTVVVDGQHPAMLRPGYSGTAARRQGSPRDSVLERLRSMGVTYGIDESNIDRELAVRSYQPVPVARGQEAEPPSPGEWSWKLNPVGLVEPGQVIATHQGSHSGRPRVTVTGEEITIYERVDLTPAFSPGKGTRLLGGGKLVATASGRARAVAMAAGKRVDVNPVSIVDGDVTGELNSPGDVIVKGNIREARVTIGGELLVGGHVDRSEVRAAGIIIRGTVSLSKLYTLPEGHYTPMRGELGFIQRRAEELGDTGSVNPQVREAWFKELGAFVRGMRRRSDELQMHDPAFKTTLLELTKLVAQSDAFSSFNRTTAQAVTNLLNPLLEEAARRSLEGDVRAKSMSQTTVWAGRDIFIDDSFVGCAFFCGGSLETPPKAQGSQSEIVAANEAKLGVLASMRGNAPVYVRSRRVEATEIQVGCALEFGAERKELGADIFRVTTGINARGFMVIKQG